MTDRHDLPDLDAQTEEAASHETDTPLSRMFHVLKNPLLLAGIIAMGFVVWIASGMIGGNSNTAESELPVEQQSNQPFAVEVQTLQAQTIERRINIQAVVEAERILTLRAESHGRVIGLPVERGARVSSGDILAQLSIDDRQARLDQANAQLAQASQDHDAATTLAERGYASAARVRTTAAQLEAARANVEVARQAIGNLRVVAPFDGVLDSILVEMGEYVGIGTEIGRLVDNNPLIAELHVPQQSVSTVALGTIAEIRTVTGEVVTGSVRYIASNADPATRTFLVEIAIDNPDSTIPSGVSAEVLLPTGAESAHFISPAILALASDGSLGVKIVDSENRVVFSPVSILLSETGGVWVSGLPDTVDVITAGQGFVGDGQVVTPRHVEVAMSLRDGGRPPVPANR